TPSGMVLKKKGDEQITALQQTTFRRENLSLAGYSSAEPVSVSVQQCKIQISKLYYQPVEIPSHFHKDPETGRIRVRPLPGQGLPTNLVIECSKHERERYPLGTKFMAVDVKVCSKPDGRI